MEFKNKKNYSCITSSCTVENMEKPSISTRCHVSQNIGRSSDKIHCRTADTIVMDRSRKEEHFLTVPRVVRHPTCFSIPLKVHKNVLNLMKK